jgi:hypothetical protein
MSNTNASEDNVESHSAYGNNACKEYRRKSKDAANTSTQN